MTFGERYHCPRICCTPSARQREQLESVNCVMPMLIAGYCQVSLYAFEEQTADLILVV